MSSTRKSGILLHPTSLPGPEGIGTLGSESLHFIDFLASAGQTLWQVLPLGPTGCGNSPYSAYSAFACNPLMIDLALVSEEEGLSFNMPKVDLPDEWVDYRLVEEFKMTSLRQAAETFFAREEDDRLREFWDFCDTTPWLHDFALFMSVKEYFDGKCWCDWPFDIASRVPESIEEYSRKLGPAIGRHKYMQWQFHSQWRRVKKYANQKGIQVIGDMPIFVAYDSADVWANRRFFNLDEKGKPLVVAGVPPDYFSKTGQLWGNPLYVWEKLAAEGYSWWKARLSNDFQLYDMVRIDHFRGFEAYWEVPAGEKSAVNGRWVKGPGESFFAAVSGAFGHLPIIAEDLGVITPEVEALRDRFEMPGMKILQFAFGSGPDNPYLPHNHVRKCVVYTGTHDNDTTSGWFASLPFKDKKHILSYLDLHGKIEDINHIFIRLALMSVAEMAVFPLQDLLGLDSSARMNIPGKSGGNWSWRFTRDMLQTKHAESLRELTELYGRIPERSEGR